MKWISVLLMIVNMISSSTFAAALESKSDPNVLVATEEDNESRNLNGYKRNNACPECKTTSSDLNRSTVTRTGAAAGSLDQEGRQ